LNTKRIDQIPICRDDDKERGLTEEKLSALKISEKLSLFHFIEKIYNNTTDLVKREVDIALEIIHHSIHAGIGENTFSLNLLTTVTLNVISIV
jgi:hypothetical protein